MRPRHFAHLLLPLVLLLTACGNDEEAEVGVRVRVLTSPTDGPIQGGLRLEALEGEVGTVFEAQLVSESEPDVFVAPGAWPGRYRIWTTEGWGMLWAGTGGQSAPRLNEARYPALTVRMGKPHTLYVAADDPSVWRVGLDWGAEWKLQAAGDTQPFERLPLTVVDDEKDSIVALHFGPQYWKRGHVLRTVGRMRSGPVTQMLSIIIRDASHPELPKLALVHGTIPAPLDVHLIPPPGSAQVVDGTPVQVSLLGVPLDVTYEAVAHKGHARFDAIAALGHGLRVSLPGSGPQTYFDVSPNTWRTRGSVYIVAVDPQHVQRPRLIEGESPVVEVRARYADGDGSFGRLAFERVEQGKGGEARPYVTVRTHAGWQDWLVRRADKRWTHIVHLVTEAQDPKQVDWVESDEPARRDCRIRGKVHGGGLGYRVTFTRLLDAVAGSPLKVRRAGGEGFSAAVSHQGSYEARLPPGRYEISVYGRTGTMARAPITLTMAPGGETHLDLQSR